VTTRSTQQTGVTAILARLRGGDRDARELLVPLIYEELRRLARSKLRRERSDHTLQTTALANEAYLKLAGLEKWDWRDRAHFFGVMAAIMRRVLIDHARKHRAARRGGGATRVPLEEGLQVAADRPQDLIALDDALSRLGALDPRQERIVELRFFTGLSVEETAEVLGISPRTVKRDWAVARAWLRAELQE